MDDRLLCSKTLSLRGRKEKEDMCADVQIFCDLCIFQAEV
jgi:hypothetical protein